MSRINENNSKHGHIVVKQQYSKRKTENQTEREGRLSLSEKSHIQTGC